MAGNYSKVKTVITGELITAADRNAEHDNHITFNTPEGVDDQSINVAQMQATVDPYPGGVESLATNLRGELERIRFMLRVITGQAQWYHDPVATANGLRNNSDKFVNGGGVADAYTLTYPTPFTSLVDGQLHYFSIPATNTGASTLDVDGLGPLPLVYSGTAGVSSPVGAGNLPIGLVVAAVYNAASSEYRILSLLGLTRSLLPAEVVYDDETNTFTQLQTMSVGLRVDGDGLGVGVAPSTAQGQLDTAGDVNVGGALSISGAFTAKDLFLTDLATNNPVLQFIRTGRQWDIRYDTAGDPNALVVYDVVGANPVARFDINAGGNAGVKVSGFLSASRGYLQPGTGGERLRIIRGTVNSAGGIIDGTGFGITKTGTGLYTINISLAYATNPSVVLSARATDRFVYNPTGSITTNSIGVRVENSALGLVDGEFSFCIIGVPT